MKKDIKLLGGVVPKILLVLVIVLTIGSGFSFLSHSADEESIETVEVLGEAPIKNENISKAKEVALGDAFRKAVTKTMGTWVSAKSFSRNFKSIENSVLTKSKGYVKNYEVLNVRVAENIVQSTVKVSVSLEPLKESLESLGILLRSMDNPRLVVRSANSIVEGRVEKALKDKGFSVIPLQAGDWSKEVTPQMIEEVSQVTKAEVLVAAKADVQRSTSSDGMWGKVINFSLESFWLDSGERIADSSALANGSGLDEDSAFKNALEKASPEFISSFVDKISTAWNDLLQNGRPIELSIDNISYNRLVKLRKRFLGMYGVKDVLQRSFEENKALLEVYFTDSSQVLADLISVTEFSNLEAKIIAVKRDELRLEVKEDK